MALPNIGLIMIQREDGLQVIDHVEMFEIIPDDKNRTTQAVFPVNVGYQKFLPYRFKKKMRVSFNRDLAIPTLIGWCSGFDIKNYDQTVITDNTRLLKLVAQMNKEQKQVIQDIIIMNTTLDTMFQDQKNWLTQNTPMMLVVFAIIILALAIFNESSAISSFGTSQAAASQTIAGAITHLTSLYSQSPLVNGHVVNST